MKNAHIIFLCVGCIVGWGAFILPQDLFLSKAGFFESIVGLLLGAIVICIMASNYSFLLNRFRKSGGEFYFTLKVFGKTHGFVCGWFLSLAYLCIIPLNATALSVMWHSYGFEGGMVLYRLNGTPIYLMDLFISIISILCVGVVHILGIKAAFILQQVVTLVLSGSVILFFCIMSLDSLSWQNLASYIVPNSFNYSAMLMVFALAPWAYLGFDCAIQIVENLGYKKRIFDIFTYLSICIGFMLYVMLLCITAFGVPNSKLSSATWATHESISLYFGDIGSVLLGVSILGAIFSGINGFFIATGKIFQSLGAHRFLPSLFLQTNSYGAYPFVVMLIVGLSCCMVIFGRESLLYIVDMACFGIIVGFFYVSIIVIYLKRGYSILGFVGLLLSVLFLLLEFLPFSPASLKLPSIIALICWIVVGFLVLLAMRHYRLKTP